MGRGAAAASLALLDVVLPDEEEREGGGPNGRKAASHDQQPGWGVVGELNLEEAGTPAHRAKGS